MQQVGTPKRQKLWSKGIIKWDYGSVCLGVDSITEVNRRKLEGSRPSNVQYRYQRAISVAEYSSLLVFSRMSRELGHGNDFALISFILFSCGHYPVIKTVQNNAIQNLHR